MLQNVLQPRGIATTVSKDKKKLKQLKSRYCTDTYFRKKSCKCSKEYYASNVQFQKLVSYYSQVKYKSNVSIQGKYI